MKKLPADSIITAAKLENYLLQWRPESDKSKFLARAGYTIANPAQLEADLRQQILSLVATFVERDRFGDKYEIRGTLRGPNGVGLAVVTIWMAEFATGQTKFITLYPNKEP